MAKGEIALPIETPGAVDQRDTGPGEPHSPASLVILISRSSRAGFAVDTVEPGGQGAMDLVDETPPTGPWAGRSAATLISAA